MRFTIFQESRKGSRAINHGGADAPAKDQRGKRKRGKRDIGAFEYRGKN